MATRPISADEDGVSEEESKRVSGSFNERLFDLARSLGADLVGVADLASARDFIAKQGGEAPAQYPFAVSVGVRLMDSLVDALPHWREERWVAHTFRYHAYDKVNDRLDAITSRLASLLQNEGYRALPVPAFGGARPDTLESLFSHKVAANLAGLGWIGKSCLLITPQAGPRVRLASVLTTAPLESTGPAPESRCGACTRCAEICPAHAFTGRAYHSDEPREARFDFHLCRDHLKEREKLTGFNFCGLCVYGCPHGAKNGASQG